MTPRYAAVAVKPLLLGIAVSSLVACSGDDGDDGQDASQSTVALEFLGRYATNTFDESAAEIVAYDAGTRQVFVVNALSGQVDVLDVASPSTPTLARSLTVAADVAAAVPALADASALGAANSVAVHEGVVAVAIEADTKQDSGYVAFYQASDSAFLSAVEVGALPDMLTFTPDGAKVVVANEGEPSDDYTVDPEGSISIIDISRGVSGLVAADVTTATFTEFNAGGSKPLPASVRVFGPGASVAQDLEPEYIAISSDSQTAWVALQENNAIAEVDLVNGEVASIWALGFKNFGVTGNGVDASDRDDGVNIRPWPVLGMYQPDAIAAYEYNGVTYLVTANEGDARDYDAYSEEYRVGDITDAGELNGTLNIDPNGLFAVNGNLDDNENLGRLRFTSTLGFDPAGVGCTDNSRVDGSTSGCEYSTIYAYGGRSFSIWDTRDGRQVYDSGDDFERITAQRLGTRFNASNDGSEGDNRSDDKGPEPEAVTLGTIGGQTYAFIGLERVGGVMVYNISNPEAPQFVQYINPRDLSVDACTNADDGSCDPDDIGADPIYNPATGDLGPEGFAFVPAADSPNGEALLVVGNEVSGTTSVFQINQIELTD